MASGSELIKAQNGVFMGPTPKEESRTQPNLQIGAGKKNRKSREIKYL